ncbi:hypothetical protein D3C87_1416510 [compost metagenome]
MLFLLQDTTRLGARLLEAEGDVAFQKRSLLCCCRACFGHIAQLGCESRQRFLGAGHVCCRNAGADGKHVGAECHVAHQRSDLSNLFL